MADKDPASKTLGEQAADTANSVRSYVASVVSGEPKSTTTALTASTEPTVAGSLANAWESVKQATGLAGEKGAETAAVGKAQSENTRVDANQKIDEFAANTKLQAENAKENVSRQADAAKLTASGMPPQPNAAAFHPAYVDIPLLKVDDARRNAAHKIEPKH